MSQMNLLVVLLDPSINGMVTVTGRSNRLTVH
jgi:hypothetical protein